MPNSTAATIETTIELTVAPSQVGGVKLNQPWTSVQKSDQPLTVPGQTSWYVTKPHNQATAGCQRNRAVDDTSQRIRLTTKKSAIAADRVAQNDRKQSNKDRSKNGSWNAPQPADVDHGHLLNRQVVLKLL